VRSLEIKFLNMKTNEIISNPDSEQMEEIYKQLDIGTNFRTNIPQIGIVFKNLETVSKDIGICFCFDGGDFSTIGKQIKDSEPTDNLLELKDKERKKVLSAWTEVTFKTTRFLINPNNSMMIELEELDEDPNYVYLRLPEDFENRFLFSLEGILTH